MNPALQLDGEPRSPIQRLFARVEDIESTDTRGNERWIRLDGVDADSLDGLLTGEPISDPMDWLGLAVVELSTLDIPGSALWGLLEVLQLGAWVLLDFERTHQVRVPVDYYPNLFGPAIVREASIQHVETQLSDRLTRAFALSDVPEARDDELLLAFDRFPDIPFATVLDVGQGNATALWERDGRTAFYFDLGGGVTANAQTFPDPKARLCFSEKPAVLLSHWDHDHWSGGSRYPESREGMWIAPLQDIGPNHRAFATELLRKDRMRLWPEARRDYRTHQLHIERCTGAERNHSGLALTITSHVKHMSRVVGCCCLAMRTTARSRRWNEECESILR